MHGRRSTGDGPDRRRATHGASGSGSTRGTSRTGSSPSSGSWRGWLVPDRHERQVPRGVGRDHPGPHHHDQRHVLRIRLRAGASGCSPDSGASRGTSSLRNVAITYIEFIRGVPILVLLFTIAFVVVPQLSSTLRVRELVAVSFFRAPCRARAHLRRVPRRGVPRRHRVGAQGPDRGRSLARAEPRSDDAQDRAPAGRPQHDARDRQRPDRDAQGLVAAVGARRSGRSPRKAGSTRARRSSSGRPTWC